MDICIMHNWKKFWSNPLTHCKVIGVYVCKPNCPTIGMKWHFWGITTEEVEGIEDCSFAAEPRTICTSKMESLKNSEPVVFELVVGKWLLDAQETLVSVDIRSYLICFMAGLQILCQFKPSSHLWTPVPEENGRISLSWMTYWHNVGVPDCPTIASKWHVVGVTTEDLEGIEDCSFTAEARTIRGSGHTP